uniref:Uncharacterized protein n=1 Tax=Magallana gigas TaxID=29159 RepID=A0A8W8L7E4_MAGGI
MCKDITGSLLKAELVIQHCIVCLKKSLVQKLEGMFKGGINGGDIEYVLTVPAIWKDNAILFMRSTAVNAGIPNKYLTIALESEAASTYCQYLKFAKGDTSSPTLDVLKSGTKYMLVDLGGKLYSCQEHY